MRFLSPTVMLASALMFPSAAAGARYFVSPDGSPSGDGTRENPWDLHTALAHPLPVVPGDVIWLLEGTYGDGSGTTLFESRLTGTPRRPILVRRLPGSRAIINGGLRIYGADTWYWGLEITSSIRDRSGLPDGTSALRNAIDCWAPGTRLINLVIHDTRQGIGLWKEAVNSEVYGSLIFNNGFEAVDRGHGHGIYTQNEQGTKLIAENLIFNQFAIGVSAYSTSASFVRGFELQGNIIFNNGVASERSRNVDNVLFASGSGVDRILLDRNFTYHSGERGYSRIGWEFDGRNGEVSARGNYWIGGQIAVMMNRWTTLSFERNVTYSESGINVLLDFPSEGTRNPYVWSDNTYYGSGKFYLTGRQRTFDEWRADTGLDSRATYTPGSPTGVWAFVRPNYYEPHRANIVVYNWDQRGEVHLDLSEVLDSGMKFEIRDAQNFSGPPVVAATFDGSPVTVPLSQTEAAQPTGVDSPRFAHTAPRFCTFILLPR